ncbi:MAG: LytTR family DNA-binding domain-containing protein [Tunicatimonas sp.]
MINAIAVDDEPLALQVISAHAARIPFLNLHKTFTDPFRALDYVHTNNVNLIFLDINMPDLSGLTLTEAIRNGALVIFTTAHAQYALESYEVEAVDYLLKPFDSSRFLKAVTRAQTQLGASEPTPAFFFVNTGHERHRVCTDEIHYLEGSGNYVIYHLASKQLLVRATLKHTLAQLPGTRLIQIQRSYAVALSHIDKVQDNHVHVGGTRLAIGPTYRAAFQQHLRGVGGSVEG